MIESKMIDGKLKNLPNKMIVSKINGTLMLHTTSVFVTHVCGTTA